MTPRKKAAAKKPASPATGRVNRGRGHSYKLDGRRAEGVTTIMKNGVPKPSLLYWAPRKAAEWAVENWDWLTELLKRPGNTAPAVIDLIKEAPWNERDEAGNRGTEVHRLAEELAAGNEVEVPDELVGMVDAYLKFREEWEPFEEQTELVVGHRKHRIMGTLDLLCRLRGLEEGRPRCLIDIKTNRSGPFGDTALQLAGYGFADFYLDENGLEVPMPKVDKFLVLWLFPDGYELYPYDVTERELRTLLYAQQVAFFVETRSKTIKGPALDPPRKEATK